MARRRDTSQALEADEILPPNGETIRITNEKTIRREATRTEEPEAVEAVYFNPADEPEEVDPEDLPIDEYLEQFFAGLDGSTSATVTVLRLADSYQYANVFRVPAPGPINCDPVRIQPGMTPDDLYSLVRRMNGSGGVYKFQLRYGRGFGRSWDKTLSNPHEQEQQQQQQAAPAAPVSPPESEMEKAMKWTQMLGEMMRNLGYKQRGDASAAPSLPSAEPPPSPLSQVQEAVNLVTAIKSLSSDLTPTPAPSGGGLISGLAQLAHALNLGQVVPSFLQILAAQAMMKSQPGAPAGPAMMPAPGTVADHDPNRSNVVQFPTPPPAAEVAEPKDPMVVLEDALEDMRRGNPVDDAAADLVALLKQPESSMYALAVIQVPAREVLETLFANDPVAASEAINAKNIDWVEQLQAKVRELSGAQAAGAEVRP